MQNPETVIANLILKTIKTKYPNVWVSKNVVAKAKLGSGFFSTVGLGVGSADILCCVRGKMVWLEIKTPTGKQSDEQIAFEQVAKASGAEYHVCRCLQDATRVIDRLLSSD
jgi:hypothetical protein